MTPTAQRSALMAELMTIQPRIPFDILGPAQSLPLRELREHVERYRAAAGDMAEAA